MKSYSEAKKIIKKIGYSRVTGDENILCLAECLSNYLQINCMIIKPKKIYEWAGKYNLDSNDMLDILKWIHKETNNLWFFWGAVLEDRKLELTS